MASPVNVPTESSRDTSRTGLASSLSGHRSYGTVKNLTPSPIFTYRASRSCDYLNHDVREEDTIQGLALCYNVTVRRQYVWCVGAEGCTAQ